MLFIDVHVWTYCRNMFVVKILRVLGRAGGGGLRLTPQAFGTDISWGLEEELGQFNPPTPDNSNTVSNLSVSG